MKATVDGITYEGTEDEIRRIVEDPPRRPPVQVTFGVPVRTDWPDGFKRNWDGSPAVTCAGASTSCCRYGRGAITQRGEKEDGNGRQGDR